MASGLALALSLAVFLNNAHLSPVSPPLPAQDDLNITGQPLSEKTFIIWSVMSILMSFVVAFLLIACARLCRRKTTILMVRVLVSDKAGDIGSVLRDLFPTNNITQSQTPVLKGTINALLKHQRSFIYGSTSAQVKSKILEERWSNLILRREVEKLGIQSKSLDNHQQVPILAPKQKKDNTGKFPIFHLLELEFCLTFYCYFYTQVIIMVVADGVHKLPSIDNSEDVKEALNYLDTKLPNILAADVIWSYEDPMLLQKLLEIFPDLKSIYA
ncbi:hypothetical protein LINPERHAP1_LOCUS25223 [Linum perenne]